MVLAKEKIILEKTFSHSSSLESLARIDFHHFKLLLTGRTRWAQYFKTIETSNNHWWLLFYVRNTTADIFEKALGTVVNYDASYVRKVSFWSGMSADS